MGASRIAAMLTRILDKNEYSIIVIDIDEDGFNRLPNDFEGEKIVGSGTDLETYKKINFTSEDAFLAATNSDNVNIEAARLVKDKFKCTKVAKVIHDPMRAKAYTEIEKGVICPILDALLYFKENILSLR